MYFACSSPDPRLLAEALLSSFHELSLSKSDGTLRLFAIVDAGFTSRLGRRVRREALSIGKDSDLADMQDHLPFVLPLDCAPTVEQLAILQLETEGLPMLSFVATPISAEALVRELRRFLIARTEDDTRWPVRFADTRILPVLLEELTRDPAKHDVSEVLITWWWPRRDGRLAAFLNVAGSSKPDASENAELALSDSQFARMMSAAQADAVLAKLYRACPELLDRRVPHENHATVGAALEMLDARRFDSAELQLRWATLALSLDQRPGEISLLANALAKAKDADDLLAHIDELADEVAN